MVNRFCPHIAHIPRLQRTMSFLGFIVLAAPASSASGQIDFISGSGMTARIDVPIEWGAAGNVHNNRSSLGAGIANDSALVEYTDVASHVDTVVNRTDSASHPAPAASPNTRNQPDTTHNVRLFRPRDLVIGVGVAALIAGITPADRSIARAFQRPSLQSPRGLRRTANVLSLLSDPGTIIFSAGTYLSGLVGHSRPIASLGMHTGEAIVLGGIITGTLKGTIGRARPRVDVTAPHDFHPGKGFSKDDYMSFPSGDVTFAFAAATAASREVSRSWPKAAKYVTPAAYGAASLVAVSRIYKNEHWASDVIGGAGVGIFAGVLVDRFNRAHPDNLFNRVFLPATIVPGRGQVTIAWVISSS